MSDKAMKIVLSVLTVILLILIGCLFLLKDAGNRTDLNKLAIRMGEFRNYHTMNRANATPILEKAFSRIGYDVFTSTEDNLYPQSLADAGVNFYVRGYNDYNTIRINPKAVNILYIRDYDTLQEEELKEFDGIATSSPGLYSYVMSTGYAAVFLPEFTDPSVFYPSPRKELERDLLYVGDNDRHNIAIATAIEAKLPVEIFGRFWVGNVEDENFKGEYIRDEDLGAYFSSAKINLVNITENEARIGIIPSRVYDVASSKGFMITPYNEEIEKVFGDAIPMFKNAEELKELYNKYINDPSARAQKAEIAYKIVVSEYNADALAQRLNGLVEFLINEKKL